MPRENPMNLKDASPGTILITVLIAAAVWYAKYPDDVHRSLSQMHLETESENLNAFVGVRRVTWSTDSRKLLSVAVGDVGVDGPLVSHDLGNRPYRMPIDIAGEPLLTAALSPDGRHVLVATHEGRLWWIGLESDERTLLLELPRRFGLSAAALSPDGKRVVAASPEGYIYLCNTESRAAILFASGLTGKVSDLKFSHDGRRLVSAGTDGWLHLWELQSGTSLRSWKAHETVAMAAAFLPDERIISIGLEDTIRIWSNSTGKEIWRGEFGLWRVHALAISPDGKTAAWGGCQQRIVVWDLENSRKRYEIPFSASII